MSGSEAATVDRSVPARGLSICLHGRGCEAELGRQLVNDLDAGQLADVKHFSEFRRVSRGSQASHAGSWPSGVPTEQIASGWDEKSSACAMKPARGHSVNNCCVAGRTSDTAEIHSLDVCASLLHRSLDKFGQTIDRFYLLQRAER